MLRNKGKGQGLVEFALILPILLLLLLGIIEGARIIWAYVTVQNAAREATRYAVTGRPFACGGDPNDPAQGGLNDGDAADPTHFCDDSTRGDPWSPQVPTMTRVAAIKNVAVEQGRNLAVSRFAMANIDEYNLYRDPAVSGASGVFGIAVIGQSAVFTQGVGNYGGEPGWNVRVETYYNVEMIDPIFNVLMGRLPIHLSGQVELQNEGIDATIQEYIGGIQFQSDNCAALGTCGSGQTPYIAVQDDFGDFTEPAGGQFTVSVNDHLPNTAYNLWFVHKDGLHSSNLTFTTDSLGGKLVAFFISVSAPQGYDVYKIYTSLASDGSNAPVATCLGDGSTNAPCFSVEVGNPTLTVRNINNPDTDQQQQPEERATWPISSSIPIYLFQHDRDRNYTITFNGLEATSMPGSFLFEGNPITQIRTDSEFGTNLNGSPAYYVATGHTAGSSLVVSSGVATATLDFSRARISIAGETDTITTTHPQDDVVGIVLRELAPKQQYQIFVDDSVSDPEIRRASDEGVIALSYRVPYASHTPGDPARTVEIFAFDYGRGANSNKIASRLLWLYTPINPYINVPGGARWPAGSPITIQLRRHEFNAPLGPDYEVYIQQGSADNPTFSQLIASVTTEQNPSTGLGEKDIGYTIPFNYTGSYIIRSFRPGSLTVPVASFDIVVSANPHISIDRGNRWPPRSEITIRLQGHAANTPYDVWLDRGGPQETFLKTVVTDEIGETTLDYTIPQSMPTRVDPDFYPIYSYLGSTVTADDGRLEVVPSDLRITRIDVPNVTFDIRVPVTVTVRNDSAVTITDTYFDSDLYIDPAAAPSLGSPLPPGQFKTWINNVPPNTSVTYDEEIVLFGQQSHQLYGRVDTSDNVAESNEGNNLYLKTIDAACPVEISDEFEGDGLPEWTPTDFGDSGPGCNAPADLPPLNTGSTLLEMSWPNGSTVDSGYPAGTVNLVRGFLGDGSPGNYGLGRSGSYGNPNYSLYVGPHGSTSNSSAGVAVQFTNTERNVTISFDYGTYYRDLESDDVSRYYFRLDGVSYTQAGQGTFLIEETPGGNDVDKNPTFISFNPRTFDLNPGTHTMVFGVHIPGNIENDNERAYMYLDNLVVTEAPSTSGPPANPAGTLWSAHFDSDAESFSSGRDTFTTPASRQPGSPAGTATGSYVTDTGAWADGALQVQLGEIGQNMSAGWSRPFTVGTTGNCITIQGYYRLHFPFNTYEGDSEYGEVLLSVDNALPQVIFTTQSLSDNGQDYYSGWVPFSVTLPNMAVGDHTLLLGGFNNQSTSSDERMEIWFDDVYVVESTPGATTSSQTESANVLTLTNYGSSALTGDDNGANAGYHLLHRPVGSGPFEVYVRVNQPAQGLAGLEIRGSAADGASAKLMFGYLRNGSSRQIKIYSRAAGSGLTVDENTDTISDNPSVWLRIRRNGDEFIFHYVVSNSDTPPTDWGTAMYTIQNFSLPDSVRIGLINAPNDTSGGTLRSAGFKHFHLCATSAPGGSGSGQGYLGTRCGQVEEDGNGLVVIDAVNTVLNQSGGGVWQTVSIDNVLGEPSMEGLAATAARPHATYQANIETGATFYVWVAGWTAASGHAGVDVGRNGSVIGTVTGFPFGGAAPGWVQMPGSVSLTNGIYTFDLWANAGNVRVFKLLLTSSPTFVPPPDGMAQSACTVIAQPHVPPLLRVCVDPLRRGDFEGTFNEVTGEWAVSFPANVYSSSSYEGNRGAIMPNYSGFRPAIAQIIQLPSWILTNTTAILNMRIGVDLNSGGTSSGSDQLNVTLRRTSDNFDLITPTVVLADGDFSDESPTPPEFDPINPRREDWILKNVDIFASLNPLSVLEASDTVEFSLYSPNAGQGTFFYVDNVSLTFCTTQPEPVQQANLGRITGRTQRGGGPLVGARVWAYAYADEGSQPGPVAETYSIQDGSYRFYNLQPGRYLVYAEITDASGTFSDVRLVEVRPGTEVRNVILNLQTG